MTSTPDPLPMVIEQVTDLGKEALIKPFSYNGFMGISILNKFFAKKRMKHYFIWASQHFKEFQILLMDDPDKYNFMVFKELPVDGEYVKGGVFQIRISIESDQTNMKASGYLEYRVRIEDEDGTKRVIDGSLFKSEDTKLKPDKTADKQFNYKEIGSLIEKLENTLYQNLYFVSLKTRLSVGEDVKLFKNNPERNVFMRAVFNESMKMKGPGVANPSQGSSAQSKNYGSMIADRKPRWGVK